MTVTYKPLESNAGFKSPDFTVDSTGNLIATSISSINPLTIDGQVAISSTALGSSVLGSNLTSVGILAGLTVTAVTDVTITTPSFTIISDAFSLLSPAITLTPTGAITLTSGTTGSINNINIGATTPGTGKFTEMQASSIQITDSLYIGSQNIKSLAVAFAIALQ